MLKLSVWLAITATLIVSTASADTAETRATFTSPGQEVVGTLALPAGDPAPVVLMLHGFTGSRDELKTDHIKEGVFAYTAGRLADAGPASLRIDFRGSGESTADLNFAETTFDGQTADGIAAIAYLKPLDSIRSDDFHIIS